MQIAGGSSVLHLHFYQIKTQWSLLLHDSSKVCLYVWIENCVIGVMHYVNMHGSKPLKKERLIFCHGFTYNLVVYVLICPSFLSFFGLPGGEKQSAFVTVQPMQKNNQLRLIHSTGSCNGFSVLQEGALPEYTISHFVLTIQCLTGYETKITLTALVSWYALLPCVNRFPRRIDVRFLNAFIVGQ